MKKNLKRFLGIFIAFTMILQTLSTPMVAFAKEITLKQTQFSIDKGFEVLLDGGGKDTTFELYKYENNQWVKQDSSLGTKNQNKYTISGNSLNNFDLTKYKVEATYDGVKYIYEKEVSAGTLYNEAFEAWLPIYVGLINKNAKMPTKVSDLAAPYSAFASQVELTLKNDYTIKSEGNYTASITATIRNGKDYTWYYKDNQGEWNKISSGDENNVEISASYFDDKDVDLEKLVIGCVGNTSDKQSKQGASAIELNLTRESEDTSNWEYSSINPSISFSGNSVSSASISGQISDRKNNPYIHVLQVRDTRNDDDNWKNVQKITSNDNRYSFNLENAKNLTVEDLLYNSYHVVGFDKNGDKVTSDEIYLLDSYSKGLREWILSDEYKDLYGDLPKTIKEITDLKDKYENKKTVTDASSVLIYDDNSDMIALNAKMVNGSKYEWYYKDADGNWQLYKSFEDKETKGWYSYQISSKDLSEDSKFDSLDTIEFKCKATDKDGNKAVGEVFTVNKKYIKSQEAKTTTNWSVKNGQISYTSIDNKAYLNIPVSISGSNSEHPYIYSIQKKNGDSWEEIKKVTTSDSSFNLKLDVTDDNIQSEYRIVAVDYKNNQSSSETVKLSTVAGESVKAQMKYLKEEYEQFFFYDNVVKDSRTGFAKEDGGHYTFREMVDKYLEKGDYAGALSFYNKYIYDVFNPNSSYQIKNGELIGSEGTMGNYGDTTFSWAKEALSPFHNTDSSLSSETSERGTLKTIEDQGVSYKNFFDNISKKSTLVSKEERKYKIDIESKGNATKVTPLAFVFQIQTSWQMFDLAHANKQSEGKNDKTAVGSSSKNTSMANLYDIKRALIRFSDYLEERGDNGVAVAITNVQHGATHSMFDDNNNNADVTMFTSDMSQLKNALYSWDTFGDCEHVHYSSAKLQNACSAVSTLASKWQIRDSQGNLRNADDVRKVGIIIGGPTENSENENGYGATLPAATLKSNLDALYGIRNNEGTSLAKGFDGISWLDNASNQSLLNPNNKNFKNGSGYYVASSEDEMYNTLVKIYNEQLKTVDALTSDPVKNVTIKDTVTNEFEVDKDRIKAYIDGKEITLDDSKLEIIKNDDGSTTVKYNFGEIRSSQTVKLEIGITAKSDFMGGNEIKTNTEPPTISYEDPKGEKHEDTSDDEPQVNVEVKIPESNQKLYTKVGESVDLSNQTKEYFEDIIKALNNYSQVNGTLKFEYQKEGSNKTENVTIKVNNKTDKDNEFELTYVDSNGEEKTIKVQVKDGKVENIEDLYSDIPLFNGDNKYTPTKEGVNSKEVKVTYTPNETTTDDPVTTVTAKTQIKVYAFNTGDDVYVFDYGKSSDLADTSYKNGLFGNDVLSITDLDGNDVDTVAKLEGLATGTASKTDTFTNEISNDQSKVKATKDSMNINKDGSTDGQVLYTPTKFMNKAETFTYKVSVQDKTASEKNETITSSNGVEMTAQVKTMPASIVYYEDNFSNSGKGADGTDGIIYSGNYTVEGEDNGKLQNNSLDMQYGYDEVYDEDNQSSGGSSTKLQQGATATFTFDGTGFDIISRTNTNAGSIAVKVYKKEDSGYKLFNSSIVNEYYENGDLYQVPVISKRFDNYGTYKVKITAIGSGKTIYIDGIRIYNPTQDGDVKDNYIENEKDANISEIRQLILGEGYKFDYENPLNTTPGQNVKASLVKVLDQDNGFVFLSGTTVTEDYKEVYWGDDESHDQMTSTPDLLTYAVKGPNNELYLDDGYGFGFEASGDFTNGTLQIGMKAVEGNPTVQYLAEDGTWKAINLENGDSTKLKTATERYYKVDLDNCYQKDGKTIVILKVNNGTASFTNVKNKGITLAPITTNVYSGNEDSSLNATSMKIKSVISKKEGKKVSITFTTSKDVTNIKVFDSKGNECKIASSSSKVKNGTKTWSVVFVTTNTGSDVYNLQTYAENGNYSQKTEIKNSTVVNKVKGFFDRLGIRL